MKKIEIEIIQWGKNRSIVKMTYPDTNEFKILAMDNDYLMYLDEMGLVI